MPEPHDEAAFERARKRTVLAGGLLVVACLIAETVLVMTTHWPAWIYVVTLVVLIGASVVGAALTLRDLG
ncbi:hypothetical protein [Nakamurella endophytica]|uniref:Uncharacterized protein n=1 Tax=Nakamurella endophytica TaxID=1748367 RepID=A0A917WGU9_9ACTN|nr:hypothetical protein [Nakamurella endophytica]GGM03053.1 hypothetical protein GCM10011594_24000 [Nakamurella endophytica]